MTDTSSGALQGVEAMVSFAMAQQGKGYSEAPGKRCGPNSYDCSGLVFASCVHAGIRPPGGIGNVLSGMLCSTTFTQWAGRNAGGNTLINPGGEYALGDLVYFDNGDGHEQPGHVGISLGNGSMVSALNTEYGIAVSPISWGGKDWGAIRLAGSMGTQATLTSAIGDITHAVGGIVAGIPVVGSIVGGASDVASGLSGVVKTFGQFDKIASHLSDPNFTKRVGKGALAGLLGLAALLILRGGLGE